MFAVDFVGFSFTTIDLALKCCRIDYCLTILSSKRRIKGREVMKDSLQSSSSKSWVEVRFPVLERH